MTVAEPRAIRWTRAEYTKMAELGLFQDRRVELIRGEVIERTPHDALHAAGIGLADVAVREAFKEGFVVRVQLPLSLGLDSDPEPDVAVVRGTHRDHRDAHPTTAVLVIEVAATSLAHDRTTKASLYAEAGLADYWIVNLTERRLEVHRDPAGAPDREHGHGYGYRNSTILSPDEPVSPLALPGVTLRVSEFFP
ncbi:MAG: Uma2 family endonuclease [Planctomycetota bacterium]|nr:Uma2 family endonuclease [Planctomycetota bacterium]